MYTLHYLVITFLFIKFVCGDSLSNVQNRLNTTQDLNTQCDRAFCLKKCCPIGQYLSKRNCLDSDVILDFSQVAVHDNNQLRTGKSVKETFGILPGAFNDQAFKNISYNIKIFGYLPYLNEDGTLFLELPNAYQRWTLINSSNYCLDYTIYPNNPKLFKLGFWAILPAQDQPLSNEYFTYATLVSCLFMLIVLVVYAALPELRNLCGMILMAYIASLFCAFLLLAIIQIDTYLASVCFGLTQSIYFFFLASFCWMNIMSYDIWWTFRGYAKARPIHRRGEGFKFCMYCLYAWGVPLLMTIFLRVANTVDLKHLPWFITPNIPRMGCFLEGGVKLLYLYVPMLIMIIFNWFFFIMTAYNVWRLGRGTAVLANSVARGTATAHRTQRHRLMVYLKLSIVMGLNWLFEVVSFVWPDFKFWYISDAYNILIGFAIFLIFVCKKKILRKLVKRYHAQKAQWNQSSKSYASNSSDSSSSPETMTLQISAHPRGF